MLITCQGMDVVDLSKKYDNFLEEFTNNSAAIKGMLFPLTVLSYIRTSGKSPEYLIKLITYASDRWALEILHDFTFKTGDRKLFLTAFSSRIKCVRFTVVSNSCNI